MEREEKQTYFSSIKISGATYSGEPQAVCNMIASSKIFASPKSAIFT